jgi:hypothetical protein
MALLLYILVSPRVVNANDKSQQRVPHWSEHKSVDLSENESNVEMGGMDDETSARENGGKKKRRRKQEDYDKEDDFIDDTELAWEQQALMAKDGFFVYSGPLVTEEKPVVER